MSRFCSCGLSSFLFSIPSLSHRLADQACNNLRTTFCNQQNHWMDSQEQRPEWSFNRRRHQAIICTTQSLPLPFQFRTITRTQMC